MKKYDFYFYRPGSFFFFSASFDFSLYGKSKDEVDPVKEKLRETAAKVIGVSMEEIGLIIDDDDKNNAIVHFFVINPTSEIQEQCDSGEYQPKIRKALEVDDEIVGLIPEQKSKINIKSQKKKKLFPKKKINDFSQCFSRAKIKLKKHLFFLFK